MPQLMIKSNFGEIAAYKQVDRMLKAKMARKSAADVESILKIEPKSAITERKAAIGMRWRHASRNLMVECLVLAVACDLSDELGIPESNSDSSSLEGLRFSASVMTARATQGPGLGVRLQGGAPVSETQAASGRASPSD